MAVNALIRLGVKVQAFFASNKLAFVTLSARPPRSLFNQSSLTTGMGIMTIEATVGLPAVDPVAELTIKRFHNLRMAIQTQIDVVVAVMTTLTLSVRKRLMTVVTQQSIVF